MLMTTSLAEIENDKNDVKSMKNDLISCFWNFLGFDQGIKLSLSQAVSNEFYCYPVYNQLLTRRNG